MTLLTSYALMTISQNNSFNYFYCLTNRLKKLQKTDPLLFADRTADRQEILPERLDYYKPCI